MSSHVFRTEHELSDLPWTDLPEQRSAEPLDETFVFRFAEVDERLGPDQRWTTWLDVERGCRGPEPRPDWVVTEQAAIDTELGILKTGKEADVFLLERAVEAIGDNPARSSLLAAKRYRTEEHRSFHRSTAYVEGRRTRNSRDSRAMAKKSSHGRSVAAGQWAYAEWDALNRLWTAGVPVPYPVQVDGTFEQEDVGFLAGLENAELGVDRGLLGHDPVGTWFRATAATFDVEPGGPALVRAQAFVDLGELEDEGLVQGLGGPLLGQVGPGKVREFVLGTENVRRQRRCSWS